MTAQKLRDAAKVLRERAGNATAGKWQPLIESSWDGRNAVGDDMGGPIAFLGTGDQAAEDTSYMATVQPLVGLALADWLGSVTACCDDCMTDESAQTTEQRHALALADLILGGAS